MLMKREDILQTIKMIRHEDHLSKQLSSLQAFIKDTYDMNVYHIIVRREENIPNIDARIDLYMDEKSYERFHEEDGINFDQEKQRTIAMKYNILSIEYANRRIFHWFRSKREEELRVFVCPHDFDMELRDDVIEQTMKQCSHKITQAVSALALPVERIFNFSGCIHVFFHTEEEYRTYEKDEETTKQIKDICYSYVKEYDELHRFTPETISLRFYSKEGLDKHYDGSTYFYLL